MKPNFTVSPGTPHDALSEYSAGVISLHQKLRRIRNSQRETVENLSRAVNALRGIALGSRRSATL
ncbi:MAG TPA: hypothetical protein VFF03_15430 [Rhodocyclaceae bacterium]|nr:hypothetical protein [Rhodocyclaceae bacterium]